MLDTLLRIVPVIPALATSLVTVLRLVLDRSPERRLRENILVLAKLQSDLPGDQKIVVGREMPEHLDDLSAEMHYRRVRRVDTSTIALMVVLNALAAGCAVAAYFVQNWAGWTALGVLALILFGFSLIGLGELYELPDGDDRVPARLRKEKQSEKKG
ncbi:hypothetical protein [Pseudactinotalea sp.]|uniref:hypothetical protein n=1 Tax=Pseudactinotalea sp. TaxID=1926260 RepID=UPI003B3AF665